mmetsp:Transcript_1308/g.3113  ORF Transcript_1308/g.3113 Transcript_1308/m.3113 type:complete len:340 (-) Transcript_1308:300-1319(-)
MLGGRAASKVSRPPKSPPGTFRGEDVGKGGEAPRRCGTVERAERRLSARSRAGSSGRLAALPVAKAEGEGLRGVLGRSRAHTQRSHRAMLRMHGRKASSSPRSSSPSASRAPGGAPARGGRVEALPSRRSRRLEPHVDEVGGLTAEGDVACPARIPIRREPPRRQSVHRQHKRCGHHEADHERGDNADEADDGEHCHELHDEVNLPVGDVVGRRRPTCGLRGSLEQADGPAPTLPEQQEREAGGPRGRPLRPAPLPCVKVVKGLPLPSPLRPHGSGARPPLRGSGWSETPPRGMQPQEGAMAEAVGRVTTLYQLPKTLECLESQPQHYAIPVSRACDRR